MSDQDIREIERQLQADPTSIELAAKFASMKRRAGAVITSVFKIRGPNGKFYAGQKYQYFNNHGGRAIRWSTIKGTVFTSPKKLEAAIQFMSATKVDLSKVQILELQTITVSEAPASDFLKTLELAKQKEKEEVDRRAAERKKLKLQKEIADRQKELDLLLNPKPAAEE
ncbi:MAG: hypothetical protein MN733_20635 [Nitrososphaera sp.]|nr:hypothetical protein [Nitrososphaera sp.]